MATGGEDKVGKFALYEVSRPAQCDNVAPKAFSHLPNTRIAKTIVPKKEEMTFPYFSTAQMKFENCA